MTLKLNKLEKLKQLKIQEGFKYLLEINHVMHWCRTKTQIASIAKKNGLRNYDITILTGDTK